MALPTDPEISIVIPARNEAESLAELLPEIASVLSGIRHEIVLVDDGSTDGTAALAARLAETLPLRRIANTVSLGKSGALWNGVRAAAAPIVVTLDGDGQNDPAFVKAMIAPLLADPGIGIVAGQRLGRTDSGVKQIGSRIANGVRGMLLRDSTRDTACGLKAFRREPFLGLPYFETMHRFLPALFLGDGWRIAHVDVTDRKRRHGQSHYGVFDRLVIGIGDLFGVWWLLRRRRRSPFRSDRGETRS